MPSTRQANLPMYDWPEVSEALDELWQEIKTELESAGFTAPDDLNRSTAIQAQWLSPDLLLGQACGLPFVEKLEPHVHLLGSGCYRLDGVPAGDYQSVLVCRKTAGEPSFFAHQLFSFAANEQGSLSGFIAPLSWIANMHSSARLSETVFTGSHRNSIKAVAEDTADVAAIDALSWELALRYEPAATELKVIGKTMPLPGLPFFCAPEFAEWPIAEALDTAIKNSSQTLRNTLLLDGLRRRPVTDYHIIRGHRNHAIEWLSQQQHINLS